MLFYILISFIMARWLEYVGFCGSGHKYLPAATGRTGQRVSSRRYLIINICRYLSHIIFSESASVIICCSQAIWTNHLRWNRSGVTSFEGNKPTPQMMMSKLWPAGLSDVGSMQKNYKKYNRDKVKNGNNINRMKNK